MDPLFSVQLCRSPAEYRPGDVMRCDYQIDAVGPNELTALEASIMWVTEGKGNEDMGVHLFERRVAADAEERDLRPLHTLVTRLPLSPLTYHGKLLQIRWRMRLRAFMKNGREFCVETPFVLSSSARSARTLQYANARVDSVGAGK